MRAAPRRSLRADLRALPAPAWFLFAGSFVNHFGSFVVMFLVLYLRGKGYSPVQAGLAVSGYGVGSLFAAAVGGYLADRIGRRNTIALSMFGAAAAVMALSQAESLRAFVALTAVAGLAAALYRPASAALLADLVPTERRLTAFAAYRLAINAGFAFGPATAGFLADRSFFLIFAGDAITSAIFGTIALFALPQGERSRREKEVRGEAFRAVIADRSFLRFLLAYVLVSFVFFQSGSTFPLHVRAGGLSNAAYGLLVSMNGAIIVIFELGLTAVTRRFPARPVIAFGIVLTGLGFALNVVAHSFPALAATVFVWTVGEMVSAPVSNAYVADLAPPHLRGRYQGAYSLTFGLGLVLAPSVGGALFGWNPTALWLSCGAIGLSAAGLVLVGPERRVAPTLAAPEPGPDIPGVET